MSLLIFEFKKLFCFRFLKIFIFVLLIVNALITFSETNYITNAVPIEDIVRIFELAAKNPNEVQKIYSELLYRNEEEEMFINNALNAGMTFEEVSVLLENMAFPNKYSSSENVTDFQLLQTFLGEVDYIRSYPETLDTIIRQAEHNLQEYRQSGDFDNSYAFKLQTKNIEIYESLKENVQIGFEYSYGWSDYFTNNSQIICIGIAVLFCSAILFTEESNTGFIAIMKISHFGRLRTAVVKLVALFLIVMSIVLVFSFEPFTIIGLRIGYSSPYNVIQSCKPFELCPYLISVGEYFIFQLSMRILFFYMLAIFIVFLSVCCYNYIIVYLGGLVFCLLNFLVDNMTYISDNNPLKLLNLVSAINVNDFFRSYVTTNICHELVEGLPATLGVYSILSVILTMLVLYKYCSSNLPITRINLLQLLNLKMSLHFQKDRKRQRRSLYSVSVFEFEFFKLFISSRYGILIIALLFIYCGSLITQQQDRLTYSEAIYREYMIMYSGKLTDEARENAIVERDYINDILGKSDEMRISYLNGDITSAEYADYTGDYRYAQGRDEVFKTIESHIQYIDYMASHGMEAWFVYDSGWNMLFFSDFYWDLYVIILVLFTGIFTHEYNIKSSSGGFVQLQHCTKNGLMKTWISKYIWAIFTSALLAVIWNTVNLIVVINIYELPLLSAPIISIEAFQDLNSDMTIMQYAVCFYCFRILSLVLLSVTLCSLTVILKGRLVVLSLTVIITLLPSSLVYFGIRWLEKFDFVSYCMATPMIINDNIAGYTIVITIICFISTWCSKRIWNQAI